MKYTPAAFENAVKQKVAPSRDQLATIGSPQEGGNTLLTGGDGYTPQRADKKFTLKKLRAQKLEFLNFSLGAQRGARFLGFHSPSTFV